MNLKFVSYLSILIIISTLTSSYSYSESVQTIQNYSSNDSSSSSSHFEKTITITGIKQDNSFEPNPVTINVDSIIKWINVDNDIHTITSGHEDDPDKGLLFNSKIMSENDEFLHLFDKSGNFNYYCIVHPSMVGKIIVK